MQTKSDVVIIGSGVAGLSLAIKLSELLPEGQINVLSKSKLEYSNSFFAQGGLAAVTNVNSNDSFQSHIIDTLASGDDLSNPHIVKLVVENAPKRIKELTDYGMNFTLKEDGAYDLALEGGHSNPRIVHAFDYTGMELINTLLKKAKDCKNIHFYENRLAIEVLKTKNNKAGGVSVLNTNSKSIEYFLGKFIVLATGGSGQVYQHTTNPSVATGDGLAMGIKAGALVSNINYIQFHPTAFYEEGKDQLSLITEAIRGFGAHIVNKEGKRFLFDYDVRGELSTRDIVSMAIFNELKKSGDRWVYLDCRHLNQQQFKTRFPQITKLLAQANIHASMDLIPIVPAAHYQCGGLKVNERGQTNIQCLYAIGECAETGLHGANRLASNSLIEGLVFANETASFISFLINDLKEEKVVEKPAYIVNDKSETQILKYKAQIKEYMSKYATISSSFEDLVLAEKELNEITSQLKQIEKKNGVSEVYLTTQNLQITALEIIRSKIKQEMKEKANLSTIINS